MSLDRTMLSVVIPIYNERMILTALAARLTRAFEAMHFDRYEVLFVSDGSNDGSDEQIAQLVKNNPIFRGLMLTRHFGHQAAVCAGLEQARGSVVCVMDGDLQDPPEVIPHLAQALHGGVDVAYAVRQNRKENIFKRAAYRAFYRMLQWAASIEIPLDAGDFCCMTRRVVDDILSLPERSRFVRGLRAWVGYKQVGVPYERQSRQGGKSKYTLHKLAALAYDGLFSFSSLPITLMQFFGFVISSLALLTAAGYIALYLAAPQRFPAGWATLVISMWFIGGVQVLFMGLLGEYVHRTYNEARARPVALVRETIQHPALERKDEPCAPITLRHTGSSMTITGGGERGRPSYSRRSAA